MAEPLLSDLHTCPLCGFEFAHEDTACHHGCPLHSACNLVRCPLCEYEFPATPRSAHWLAALFRRLKDSRPPRPRESWQRRHHPPPAPCPDRDTRLTTVRQLAAGEDAIVAQVDTDDPERSNALAVFGLVPGAPVTLLQRQPSYVLQVGETQLALDADVAASIVVRRGAEREAEAA